LFSYIRLGNVLDSRGSVVPLFTEQIKKGSAVTIIELNMTRFVMNATKVVALLLEATEMARGGEVFILKMTALRIGDLADVMVDELAPKYVRNKKEVKVEIIGKRPGEKLYEELMTEEEAVNATKLKILF